jgi:hypothetical protein
MGLDCCSTAPRRLGLDYWCQRRLDCRALPCLQPWRLAQREHWFHSQHQRWLPRAHRSLRWVQRDQVSKYSHGSDWRDCNHLKTIEWHFGHSNFLTVFEK